MMLGSLKAAPSSKSWRCFAPQELLQTRGFHPSQSFAAEHFLGRWEGAAMQNY